MTESHIGAEWHPRVEDDALVRGQGRFVDDHPMLEQCYGCFVRSPYAFARIRSVDAAEAARAPGVLAVLTGEDLEAAGVGSVARVPPITGRGGKPLIVPHRPSLARDRVLHVGQPVALVVAESAAAAQDAAELVVVDYEELAPVADLHAVVKADAPQLWPEAPGNIAIDWPGMTEDEANVGEVERIFASAATVARVSVTQQRVVIATMEPRGATASYDRERDVYHIRSCSQGAGPLRDQLAGVMNVSPEQMHVTTEDVGGAFGMKTPAYPEYPALLVAARKLGRPVHWMSSRAEAFQSDNQGRDNVTDAELAIDGNGRFLALRLRHLANLGAFVSAAGANLATTNWLRNFPTVYDISHIEASARCVFTNTLPTGPYRGAGRPEANYVMERLVDEAARVTGIDPVEIRRRNLIPAAAMPYKTVIGSTYDSGEFEAILDRALELADHAGFKKRRAQSAERGRLRGFGISCFLEHSGGMWKESASLAFPGGEKLVLGLGVQSTGQGHATVFPRVLAEQLGIDPAQITHRHGDSELGITGYASVGSRSAMTAGHAIVRAAEAMVAKGKKIAAVLFEAAEDDVAYRDGVFEIAGTNRRLPLFELAEKARELLARGKIEEGLDTMATVDTALTFPNGCHIAEVEIDPNTGVVTVASYVAVDDCGNVLDHTIVEAQVQGGFAQGLGQVLFEHAVYDPDTGQLATGTFMDYGIPRADQVPDVVGSVHSVPAKTNPLGVKGVGEAGTTASLAAIMNAIADAIPGDAGAKLDMPATPEKVWRACREARAEAA